MEQNKLEEFDNGTIEMQQYVKVQQFPIIYWQTNTKNLSLNPAARHGEKEISVVSQTVNHQFEEVIEEANIMLRCIRQTISSFPL